MCNSSTKENTAISAFFTSFVMVSICPMSAFVVFNKISFCNKAGKYPICSCRGYAAQLPDIGIHNVVVSF